MHFFRFPKIFQVRMHLIIDIKKNIIDIRTIIYAENSYNSNVWVPWSLGYLNIWSILKEFSLDSTSYYIWSTENSSPLTSPADDFDCHPAFSYICYELRNESWPDININIDLLIKKLYFCDFYFVRDILSHYKT